MRYTRVLVDAGRSRSSSHERLRLWIVLVVPNVFGSEHLDRRVHGFQYKKRVSCRVLARPYSELGSFDVHTAFRATGRQRPLSASPPYWIGAVDADALRF